MGTTAATWTQEAGVMLEAVHALRALADGLPDDSMLADNLRIDADRYALRAALRGRPD